MLRVDLSAIPGYFIYFNTSNLIYKYNMGHLFERCLKISCLLKLLQIFYLLFSILNYSPKLIYKHVSSTLNKLILFNIRIMVRKQNMCWTVQFKKRDNIMQLTFPSSEGLVFLSSIKIFRNWQNR